MSQRHSRLAQITKANVNRLELKWVFQAQSLQSFEATPLVVDGVMYLTQPPNDVVALDARTGCSGSISTNRWRRRAPVVDR
jgi:glucose dehydrogenase